MNIAPLVPRQVPEFIRAEYPAFIEFLKAYYEWLEQEQSLGNLENIVDIDKTLDDFIQYFRKQLDIYGATIDTSDERLFLRHIKELYTAKGSTASFEFLFKILYNKNSTVVEPWDFVFIPSNGNWVQDTSIIVRVVSGDVFQLDGNPAIISDIENKKYKVFVKNIVRREENIFELFVTRFSPQVPLKNIVSAETLAAGVQCEVLTTTSKATVENGGKGFTVGQLFVINSYSGTGTLCKVKSVDNQGSIKSVEIINFGTGYQSDFNIVLSPSDQIDPSELGSRIQLNNFLYPTNDVASSQRESGAIIGHDYTNLMNDYMVDPTYVGETLAEITSQEGVKYIVPDFAIIRFTIGQFCVYPGYYRDSNNILGDFVHIQDSYYYQAYSYVTVVGEALAKYRTLLTQILHPTGTKHFGTYLIDDTFSLGVDVDPSLNVLIKDDILRDFVLLNLVEEITFAIESYLSTEFNATDLISKNVDKYLDTEFATVSDETSFLFSGNYLDSISASDEITEFLIAQEYQFLDAIATLSQIVSITVDKYLNDDVSTSNGTSGLYMTPYYVDPSPPYWQAGFLENERELTN